DVPLLVQPILAGVAEMVIGDRTPHRLRRFGPGKRLLQRIGSWVVRQVSGTRVPDAASGFRAFSRRAALRLNVFSEFTYTLETIIQAGKKHIPIAHVPVETNPEQRPSRLFGHVTLYVRRSIATLVRIYALYEPLKVFWRIGAACIAAGGVIGARFLYYYLTRGGAGHVQSLILAAVLLIVGFQTMLIGLVADLIGASRSLQEDTLVRVRRWRRLAGPPPLVVVGFGGQLDVLLARRLCRPRAGLVFAPLVSLTETLVDDRRLVAPGGLGARALAWLDRASLRAADLVLADTRAHAGYLAALGAPRGRLAVWYLGVEPEFLPTLAARPVPLLVLFYVLLLSLHGVE